MSLGRKLGRRLWGRRPLTAPDADLVRSLAALMAETGLGEIEYAVGDERIRVARGTAMATAAPVAVSVAPPEPTAPPASSPSALPNGKATNGFDHHAEPAGVVKSPMVGTVFLAGEPGAAPFVSAGQKVREGETLVIIEAMKVMNPITAPRAGTVARILVQDSQPVEYDQPLLILE